MHVFIPTKGRWHDIDKLCRVWDNLGFRVHLMVEPSEQHNYHEVTDPKVLLHQLDADGMGVTHARASAVRRAHDYGMKSIILADDDIKPGAVSKANMDSLARVASHPKVMGVTARYSYHDLCLGPEFKLMSKAILLPTGTFRMVGLNVDNVMNVLGNYDETLEYAEDCDLFLRSLQEGFPWLIHAGTWTNSIGKRYQPGGMLAFAGGLDNLKVKKIIWHETLYDQYPEFVNDPAKADFSKQNSIRISWRKAYDHYLPDWKKWSALHGGDIREYLNA